ncbi:hypothetical protein TIFTF001_028348 [Ficus carica]|uniref:Uncharacterized protein n=1 Tax=Ficus carica TaxID=3494 RepID=A0AA88DQ93_FICCA|nr:hypothetical protein TIFTF001_028348 [Ficus carica]
MTIPEIEGSSSIYRRSSRARVLGETRSGQLPRAPDGRLEPRPAGAIGPIDWRHVGPDSTRGTEGWLSLRPHGQILPEQVAVVGDVMCCRSRWVTPVADGYRDKAGVSCDERWRVCLEDLCRYGIYCSDSGARSTASSERMACSGENGERGRPMILFSANVWLFGRFPRKRALYITERGQEWYFVVGADFDINS